VNLCAAPDTESRQAYIFLVVDRLSELKNELAFLLKRLPDLQETPALERLATDCLKKIALVRQQIEALEGKK
jgi:hypothetical protein